MPEIPSIADPGAADDAITPGVDEVEQRDIVAVAVPVKTIGPVSTIELPARTSVMRCLAVTVADQVLGADPRRKRAYIVSLDNPIFVGMDRNSVASSTGTSAGVPGAAGGVWPANVPLPLLGEDAIWVASAAAASAVTRVTIVSENWAD